jgi:hypothetical protein
MVMLCDSLRSSLVISSPALRHQFPRLLSPQCNAELVSQTLQVHGSQQCAAVCAATTAIITAINTVLLSHCSCCK